MISESAGSSDSFRGYTFDQTIYDVKVSVSDDGKGRLTADVSAVKTEPDEDPAVQVLTETKGSASEAAHSADKVLTYTGFDFINHYQPSPVSVQFKAHKQLVRALNGKTSLVDFKSGDFSFTLKQTAGPDVTGETELQTVANGTAVNNGEDSAVITFDPIKYEKAGTYQYTITENPFTVAGDIQKPVEAGITIDAAVRHISVEVSDDGSGKLCAEVLHDYYDNKAEKPDERKAEQKKETIQPVSGTDTELSGSSDIGYFTNVLTPVSVTLGGTKHFEIPAGTAETLEGEKLNFTFHLEETSDGQKSVSGGVQDKTLAFDQSFDKQKADGTEFSRGYLFDPITFDREGTYYFTVTETEGNDSGVSYDTASYRVTVVVSRENGSALNAAIYDVERYKTHDTAVSGKDTQFNWNKDQGSAQNVLDFTNRYQVSGTASFKAHKTLTDQSAEKLRGRTLKEGEFKFELKEVSSFSAEDRKKGTVLAEGTNDAAGNVIFTSVTKEGADAAGSRSGDEFVITYHDMTTHRYVLCELIPDSASREKGMTYDDTVYELSVEPKLNAEKGTLDCTPTITKSDGEAVEGGTAEFVNTYRAPLVNLSLEKSFKGEVTDVSELHFTLSAVQKEDTSKEVDLSKLGVPESDLKRTVEYHEHTLTRGTVVHWRGFTETWSELPKYDAEGHELEYHVSEEQNEKTEGIFTVQYDSGDGASYSIFRKSETTGTDNYTAAITNCEIVNIHGTKTWNDGGNVDGVRPDQITVHLLQNGVEFDSRTVKKEDGWKYAFTGLPYEDKDGNAYVYTISEDAVSGYTTTVTGYDLVNTHVTESTTPETPPETSTPNREHDHPHGSTPTPTTPTETTPQETTPGVLGVTRPTPGGVPDASETPGVHGGKRTPQTGDSSAAGIYGGGFLAALAAMLLWIREFLKRKKKK